MNPQDTLQPIPPPRPARTASKTLPIVAGSLLALAGTVVALAGGVVFGVFGADASIATGSHELSTPTAALVSPVTDLEHTATTADVLGDTRVQLSVSETQSDRGVFIGVAREQDLDRYLSGVAHDEVADIELDPYRLDRDRVAGADRALAPPATQSFWVARSLGNQQAKVNWKVTDGDYRVVVMNADGSRHVNTNGGVGVTVPNLPEIALSIVVGGLLLLAGGIVLLVLTLRSGGPRPGSAVPAPAPAAG